MKLVSCHGFMKKPNSTFLLNFQSRLVNKYLSKGLFIIEKYSKKLILLQNDVKLRIHVIDPPETFYGKKTAISSAANTINKLHIQFNLHLIYQQD